MNQNLHDRYVYKRAHDPFPILSGLQREPNINTLISNARSGDTEAKNRVASIARSLFDLPDNHPEDDCLEEVDQFLRWIHVVKEDSYDLARHVAVSGTPPGLTYLEWFCLTLHESTIRWLRIDDQVQALRVASGKLPPLEYYQAIYGSKEGSNRYGEMKLAYMMSQR